MELNGKDVLSFVSHSFVCTIIYVDKCRFGNAFFLKCFCIESLSELPELPEREEKEQETEKEEAKTFEVPAEDSTAQPVQPEPEEDDEDFDFDEFDVDAGELENMYE